MRSKGTKIKDIEINKEKANEVIGVSSKILKIVYLIAIGIVIYLVTIIMKQWGVLGFLGKVLRSLSPLFIGLLIAWLLDPLVKKLTSKGMKRALATILVFAGFLALLALIISLVMPMLWDQINDFIQAIPSIIGRINEWLDNIFSRFSSNEIYDITKMKTELLSGIQNIGSSVTTSLPKLIINIVTSMLSGVGIFLVGLLIAFYMLFDFEGATNGLLGLLPKKWQKETKDLMNEINTSLRNYVQGMIFVSTILFVLTSLAFWIVGLQAPLLFGLICGVTNIIPYVGAYIAGVPAALVGFAQSPTVGILTVVVMFVIQFIEGNILQPLIMGKAMKLHPLIIITGLLIFGSLFGVLGLIIATPIIATGKIFILYFDKKFNILKWLDLNKKIKDEEQ